MKLFNLIISHVPGKAGYTEALRYIRAYLPTARVFYTRQSIILLKVDNPREAVKKLYEKLPPESPILRAIPVDEVVLPYIDEVIEVVKRLYPKLIGVDETFAVRVEGKLRRRDGTIVSRVDAQREIGAIIDRKVNLKNPDKIVLVKVVKLDEATAYAAISFVKPSEVYSRARLSQAGF